MAAKKTLHKVLEKLDGYLISIERNVENSYYELKAGFRKDWVYKSTDDVECNVDVQSDNGSIVTISGKHDDVIIDDLIEFVIKVIDTNKKITEKQEQFDKLLEERKKALEEEILKFQQEMDEFTKNSFVESDEKEKTDGKESIQKEKSDVFTDADEDVIQKIS